MATDAINFYKEEIRHDDQSIRLYTVKRTVLIAYALGPQRTVDELIPFLYSLTKEEVYLNDDEFLFRTAEQYIALIQFVGTNHSSLIGPLEWLAYQEETVIRDKAIEGLGTLCEKGLVNVSDEMLPVLQRLASAEWFTARLSVCPLFCSVYPKVSDQQKAELRKTYAQLAGDETPMVRRAAALNLKDFCKVIERPNITQEIIPVYRQLAQDDTQDIIRVACVHTSLVLIEKHFRDNPEDNKTHTLLVITNSAEDRSWRVRVTIAQNFNKISLFMGSELTATFLLNPFVALMKDSEQEIGVISKLVEEQCLTQEQLQNYVVPQFQSLALDPSFMVRTSLASVICVVAANLGRDLTQRLLLNSISDLMKDENHEVRLTMVQHAADICTVLGMDVLAHSLLGTIQALVMDNQWRIRKSVIDQIPELARQFGPDLFHAKLSSMFYNSLNDSVYMVRHAAINNIGVICKNFGAEWSIQNLLPKIEEHRSMLSKELEPAADGPPTYILYSTVTGFSTRLTILHTLPQMATVLSSEQVQSMLCPILMKGLTDTVPNVRYCACRLAPQLAKGAGLSSAYVSGTLKTDD